MKVIVTQPTEGAMAYAKALEKRGFSIIQADTKMRAMRQCVRSRACVLTRPVAPVVAEALSGQNDVEGLGAVNLGLLALGDENAIPPAIGVAVEEWLGPKTKDPVDVIGHGLGTAITLWLERQGWNVCHWHYKDFAGAPHRPMINASRKPIARWFDSSEDGRLLDLPANPPEFSRRLIDIVVERAEMMACGKS